MRRKEVEENIRSLKKTVDELRYECVSQTLISKEYVGGLDFRFCEVPVEIVVRLILDHLGLDLSKKSSPEYSLVEKEK